jgi:hypothetical protein
MISDLALRFDSSPTQLALSCSMLKVGNDWLLDF